MTTACTQTTLLGEAQSSLFRAPTTARPGAIGMHPGGAAAPGGEFRSAKFDQKSNVFKITWRPLHF
jgi:hypothetical protein